jgi:hypothetical protein
LQEPIFTLHVDFETNVVQCPVPPPPNISHHAQLPPILSITPNARINPIDVGDDLGVDVDACEYYAIFVEG